MTDLGATDENFPDIGRYHRRLRSLSPFPQPMHERGLEATFDMVKCCKPGQAAAVAFGDHPRENYPDQYARSRAVVKYSLILSFEGTVLPLPIAITTSTPPPCNQGNDHHQPPHHHPTGAEIPSDLHEISLTIFRMKYITTSLGPQALVWLTMGQINEGQLLDNGDTTEYWRFVKEVITEGQTGPRATTLALISSVCHRFWENRKVTPYLSFDSLEPDSPYGSRFLNCVRFRTFAINSVSNSLMQRCRVRH